LRQESTYHCTGRFKATEGRELTERFGGDKGKSFEMITPEVAVCGCESS